MIHQPTLAAKKLIYRLTSSTARRILHRDIAALERAVAQRDAELMAAKREVEEARKLHRADMAQAEKTVGELNAALSATQDQVRAAWDSEADMRRQLGVALDPPARYQDLPPVPEELNGVMFGQHALVKLLSDYDFDTVLDIGSGAGEQAAFFLKHGKKVTALDYGKSPFFDARDPAITTVIGDFNTYEFDKQFDCVWASHVLEHQLNTNLFLRKVHHVTREGGVVAITVPPLKHEIVGGHVALWNAGLILYHLVLAGFNCRKASARRYGYNISVIVQKESITLPEMGFDSGDIRRIKQFLPDGLEFNSNERDDPFEGNIWRLNW